MDKMQIKFDEVELDKEYYVEDVWKYVDGIFNKIEATKEIQEDGSVVYTSKKGRDGRIDMAIPYVILTDNEVVGKYCTQWLWFTDTYGFFGYDDILEREREKNILFHRD